MTWTQLRSAADVEKFLDHVGEFHDACIKELHLWTEAYVNDDLAMNAAPGHLDMRARLLVQRQFHGPSGVELLFEEVTGLHVAPAGPDDDRVISMATMRVIDGVFYWADGGGWDPGAPNRDTLTWIGGHKLSWRDASSWMGPALRYGPADGVAGA